jgi:hypothetical protein
MAFIRRGNIQFPHKGSTSVALTRLDGLPLYLLLSDINCWEEHQLTGSLANFTTIYHGLNSTVVKEPFDHVSEIINGKAVQP